MVTIPGPLLDGRPDQQELVLNDVVEVPLKYAREVLDGKWGQDLATPSPFARTRVSQLPTPRKTTFSNGPTWLILQSHGWSISASSSG